MPASGPSAIRMARSTAAAAMASITAPIAAPCGFCDADRSRCDRRVTRSSMAVSPRPLWDAPTRLPVGNPHLKEAQFAELVKFCYLWSEQSFSYEEDYSDGGSIFAGIDDPPIAGAGGRSETSVGYRSGETASPHPARGHAAASQFAGAGRIAFDPAYQRRHAADGSRPRSACAHRAHRGRDRILRNLARYDL